MVARTLEELELLRGAWDELPWEREEAAYEYFTTRLATRPDVIGPFAAVAMSDGRPVGGLAGRLELGRLTTMLGYKVVYAPQARVLRVVDGGLAIGRGDALAVLRGVAGDALASGEADVVSLPPLELGSPELAAFESLGGPLTRQPLIAPWTRRLLDLPDSFDDFLVGLGHRTRKSVRRDARQLDAAFGDRLQVEVVRDPAGVDRLIEGGERVASSTYQRKLGAGLADTPEQRALAGVGLEHGWVRGYLLSLDATAIAYWLCSVFGDTIILRTGGYDPAFAENRVGIFLLMRVIEDACADPSLRTFDFGPGDAAYKQQFSNRTRRERNVVVFAPSFRGRQINATRTAILAPARLARATLDAASLTDRVRTGWRRRLGRP